MSTPMSMEVPVERGLDDEQDLYSTKNQKVNIKVHPIYLI